MAFEVTELAFGAGQFAICPLPGRGGDYLGDLAVILDWQPSVVLTMTTEDELSVCGAGRLGAGLLAAGVDWQHLPITDFGTPGPEVTALWPEVSARIRATLNDGGRVLVHCMGGCGRSGMAVLRLMVEAGERPDAALARLRAVRPCAVETDAQKAWAAGAGMA